MKAIIFAAGLGTRLRPLTNTKPKALIKYYNVPLLELVINKLKKYGFTDIIINIHYLSDQIVRFVNEKNNFGINISFSDESEQLLDTGGGLKKAGYFFDDNKPFLVYNVDIVSDINLSKFYNAHLKMNSLATLAVQNRKSSRKLFFSNENELCKWKNIITGEEKIARVNSNNELHAFAFSGIHVINPKIFKLITEVGNFSIIDLYLRLAKTNKISYYTHNNTSWEDIGIFKKEKTIIS